MMITHTENSHLKSEHSNMCEIL